eukprot:scaffold59896_cov37-Phaeocystis_antarctica.AAC.3
MWGGGEGEVRGCQGLQVINLRACTGGVDLAHERGRVERAQHPLELLAQVAPVEPQRLERVEISLEARMHRRARPVDLRVVGVGAPDGEH